MRSPPRGLLAIQRFRGFRCALLCDGVRIFEDSPPPTEVWLRYAAPQVASLINSVADLNAANERRRSRSVFPRSGTSLAGGERPIDQKPLRCDGLTRNHKISSRKEPPVAYANRPLGNTLLGRKPPHHTHPAHPKQKPHRHQGLRRAHRPIHHICDEKSAAARRRADECRQDKNVAQADARSEEHTSELQSRPHLVCRLLREQKK